MTPFAPTVFADADLVDIRRFAGYPALGTGVIVFPFPWWFKYYQALETRLQNLTADEGGIVQQYLTQLRALESAIPGAGANLDTDQATVGQSVAYLIEIGYQDQDTDQTVLPYYNAANPTVTLSGPGGDGAAQATRRKGVAVVQAKAGTAAATGSQVPPAADSGFLAAYVVAIAYGQTTITSANIAPAPAPPLLAGLLNSHHGGVPGQAPQINLATEVQGLLPAANIAPGALASALPAPTTINVTTAGASLVLTALQAASPIIRLTGTLGANLTVVFPAGVQNQWAVVNGTIGGFTVTCVTAAGGSAGYLVRQGFTYDLYSDGTNMLPDGQPTFNGTVAVASLSPTLQLNEVYWLTS